MPRHPHQYLEDIINSVESIRIFISGMNYESFKNDKKTIDAVVRNLEVIGEAAGHLPPELMEEAPEIEWRKIIAMRNILIHEYFGIHLPIIWDVVMTKLDTLMTICHRLLNQEESQ